MFLVLFFAFALNYYLENKDFNISGCLAIVFMVAQSPSGFIVSMLHDMGVTPKFYTLVLGHGLINNITMFFYCF